MIRLVSPEGVVSVLLTNLYNDQIFHANDIIKLYFRRWEIEVYYRDEKTTLEIEKFHGKTPNSIRQELFAIMIMAVIARTMMVLSSELSDKKMAEPQFKHAISVVASDVLTLVADDPIKAIQIFQEILKNIARVRYYRRKTPMPPMPRVTKKPINKWADSKMKKSKIA